MSRPALLLLLIAALFVGFIGVGWLDQPPSNQELLANYAKVRDYATQAASVGGIPWWTPNYLQGSSLAFLSIGALTNLALFLGSMAAGPSIGLKIVALAFLFLCPFTMYGFVRRLCPDSKWTAFWCGVFYLVSPPILLRLGHVEHVGNVLAFAFLPLSFWSVLTLLEQRTLRSALACAAANALMVLAYAKIAVLVLPLLLAFALWVWIARAQFALPHWRVLATCVGAFLLLGVLFNLPSLKENASVVGFSLGPFEGWQKTYSLESALSLIDRDSALSGAPGSRQSEVRTNSAYLGLVSVGAVLALFLLRRRKIWLSPEGSAFRLFIALGLTAHWLGFGVHNALTAQLAFLSHAANAWDPAIAISWALLVLQGVMIALILPGSLPSRVWWATAAILIYYLVPGFRIIEKLPLYGDLRAPHDFFEMGGSFCFVVAAGIAAHLVLHEIPKNALRALVGTAAILLATVDSWLIIPSFFRGPMSQATYDDFLAAQKHLSTAPIPGNVFPFSGRYFYLLTPVLSGRPLVTEAFTGHLMSPGVARLQQESFTSQDNLRTFYNLGGVAYLFIDRKDPDTPVELQDSLKRLLSTEFENEHFLLLKNPTALAPAAIYTNFTASENPPNEMPAISLAGAARGVAIISGRSVFGDNAGQVDINEKNITKPVAIPASDFHRVNAHTITINTLPGKPGWLVIPESFHPDWQASLDGRPLEIARAFGGYLALRLNGTGGKIELKFVPPWWYSPSIYLGLLSWLVIGGLLAGNRLGLLPASLRTALNTAPQSAPAIRPVPSGDKSRAPIRKPLLIIPTYNEARGIHAILERSFQAHPALEILVVDDGSPDGTANIIKEHPAYEKTLHLLQRPGKLGLGSAYKDGFQWALERDFDACLEMDADLSHNPDDIPRLIAGLDNGADAAIGSRYLEGVRVMNWPQDRLFLSLGASKFVRLMTSLPLTDATSGFKALRCETLRMLDWKSFKAEGYGFQVELHYFLWKSGAHIVEVPIIFTERREGNTKMTTGIAIEALSRVVKLGITGK